MLEIFHSTGTRGFRVIWACEELSVPYKVIPVDFSPAYRATPTWREISPIGKVPVMREGAELLFESGAMVQHIVDRYDAKGELQPAVGSREHAEYLQWSWFAESTFSRPLGEITNHRREFPEPIEACIEEMRNRARLCVQALEAHLTGRSYLVAERFSAADIMMGYSLRGFQRNVPDDELPAAVAAYYERITARDAYRATVAAETF